MANIHISNLQTAELDLLTELEITELDLSNDSEGSLKLLPIMPMLRS